MSYLVVALPEDKTLEELQSIRDYYYQNNFRYNNKPCTDKAHISLARISNISDGFIQSLNENLENEKRFMLPDFTIHIQEHKRIYKNPEFDKKYPNGCGWFTLLFPENRNLVEISQKIMDIANEYLLDESYAYVQDIIKSQNIETQSDINIFDYIANHMNICNYIRLEKMKKAREIFENEFNHDRILIDKIGIRNKNGDIVREFKLSI